MKRTISRQPGPQAKELRQVMLDKDTGIEAYRFKGVMQKFPNHFHEHYVIGFIEKGNRRLVCREGDYTLCPGDILLLNPGDNHACEGLDGKGLDYRCLNIPVAVMHTLTAGVFGKGFSPGFVRRVTRDEEALALLHTLHRMILREAEPIGKEETTTLLLAALVSRYAEGMIYETPPASETMEKARRLLTAHCAEGVRLAELAALCGMGQYTLIRSFAKEFGITPYRYLETVRVNGAKRLLEEGLPPIEAAAKAGFADQSHFTRCFKSYTGLTPSQYSRIFNK